jgi:hypothetical protein
MNAAARIVSRTGKFTHITPVLKDLHWLPIRQRILYKLAVLTFKCIYGQAPDYLSELVNIRVSSRALRTCEQTVLSIPLVRTATGQHSFYSAAPAIWNNLPPEIRSIYSLDGFKSKLKTFLFDQAFN